MESSLNQKVSPPRANSHAGVLFLVCSSHLRMHHSPHLSGFLNRDWRYYSCDCPPIARYPPNFPDGRLSCDSPPQSPPYMAPLSRFALLRCTACIVAVGQSQWLRKTSLDPPCGTIAATLPPPPKHGTVSATEPTFLQPEMLYPTVTQFYHCSTVFVLHPFLHLGSGATLSLK